MHNDDRSIEFFGVILFGFVWALAGANPLIAAVSTGLTIAAICND